MKRLTTDTPSGNFETMLNFVYGKDGWAYIRRDGEHENVRLTDWAKRQCKLHGCDEVWTETPEEIDQQLCDCMMESPICPIAMAYCFASQAVHLRSRLSTYEDTGLEPEEVKEFLEDLEGRFIKWVNKRYGIPAMKFVDIMEAEKDGRLVVLPCKVGDILFAAEDSPVILVAVADMGIVLDGPGGEDWESLSNIGKTVFLTREEAEAALKKRGGED